MKLTNKNHTNPWNLFTHTYKYICVSVLLCLTNKALLASFPPFGPIVLLPLLHRFQSLIQPHLLIHDTVASGLLPEYNMNVL